MLSEGVYLPPSAFESYFLNDALTLNDIDYTVEKFKSFLKKHLQWYYEDCIIFFFNFN